MHILWPTGGSTATPTESRPPTCRRQSNILQSLRKSSSAPTITSSIWRRIRMVIVRIIRAGCRINPRSQRWASRRDRQLSGGSCVEPEGYQLATSKIHVFLQENAGCFRRRRLPEVYRWFSVRKVLGEEPFVGGRYRAQLVRHQTE